MKVFKIIFRIIQLPFYAVVLIIALIRVFILHMAHFVAFGGESIAYNKAFNPDTIGKLLEKHLVNNKLPFQNKVDQMAKDRKS